VVQNKIFSVNKTLRIRNKIVDLSIPKVMGIINITPDSFYEGSRVKETEVLKKAERLVIEGADFIDLGGYSTRPGAKDITVEEEWNRVKPAIQSIRKEFSFIPLSIDTFRSQIASQAINEGCDLINDVSAGQLDDNMHKTAAQLNVPYIIMHMKGTPQTMSQLSQYDHLIKEIIDYFHKIIHSLHSLGVKDIIIDPGFGFAKTIDQNFELLNQLESLAVLGIPMLVGLSRKSMIWKALNVSANEALNGTIALNTIALQKGASILRVHDVKAAKETIQLLEKLNSHH
jgi:dihydropteroate synthase